MAVDLTIHLPNPERASFEGFRKPLETYARRSNLSPATALYLEQADTHLMILIYRTGDAVAIAQAALDAVRAMDAEAHGRLLLAETVRTAIPTSR